MTVSHRLKLNWLETKQTLKLALPIMTSQLGQLLLGVVDSIMIGHTGIAPLGASAFVGSVFAFFLVFGFGLCSAVAPLVARADGAQDSKGSAEILRHGIYFSLFFGILLALFIHFLSFFLEWFKQPLEVQILSKDYLQIMGWSLVPALIFHVLRQFSEGLSKPLFPMLVVILSVGLNAFLNWLWIYGNWGFDSYGLNGAGWATFVTRIFMCVVVLWYVFCSRNFKDSLPITWRIPISWAVIRDMLKIGVSGGFQTVFEVGAFVAAAVMMGWLGTQALAAHQVALSVVSMTFMVTLGISFAVGIRVGHSVGRADIRAARRIGLGGIFLGAIWMAVCGILIYFAQDWLPLIYVKDPEVIALASTLLVYGAFFQIFDGAQGVAIGALRGMMDIKVPTLITFFVYWVLSMPLVYFLGFRWGLGPQGIWIGLTVGLVFAAFMLTSRFDAMTKAYLRK